jgi:hypothetical protein
MDRLRHLFLAAAIASAASSAQIKYEFPPLSGTGQESTFRTQAEVAETAAAVLEQYSGKKLAEYGVLDVTLAPYNAKPDGRTDNTEILRRAIKDARDARLILYLPPGAYAVTDTIQCVQGALDPVGPEKGDARIRANDFPCVVQGTSTGGRAILRLLPESTGFGDPAAPRPLLLIWAREWTAPYGLAANVSFGQMVRHLDIDLGGNPGAIGMDFQGAQGTGIEDVAIDARGAWAGLRGLQGSGGSTRGLTVRGGRYGVYASPLGPYTAGSQPVPLVTASAFHDQEAAAIYYNGRGPLVVVGTRFAGRGIVCAGTSQNYNGALTVVDSVFEMRSDAAAIESNRPIHASNTWLRGNTVAVRLRGIEPLQTEPDRWTRLREYAAAPAGPWPIWVDGGTLSGGLLDVDHGADPPPADLLSRHHPRPLPEWDSAGIVNVRAEPYSARGDGVSDDTEAIQKALDEHESVLLPKGRYRVSRPLRLGPRSALFGVNPAYSVLLPLQTVPAYTDAEIVNPIVETDDDAGASSVLAMLQIRVAIPGAFALRWRAGRNSVVSDISIPSWPFTGTARHASVLIEGGGGGQWYNFHRGDPVQATPAYRHILVRGTHEPLSFYMFNPEHARGETMVELDDAHNLSIYAMKAETIAIGDQASGTRPLIHARNSSNLRIFGHGGIVGAAEGWPDYVLRFENCSDLLLSNFAHQEYAWFADARRWSVAVDAQGEQEVRTPATEHFTLYLRRSSGQ